MLAMSFSGFDPGCVKTCTSQECAELFSLSSSLSSGRKHFWFSNLRNRDRISTRRLNVGVFTQPRPKADIQRTILVDQLGGANEDHLRHHNWRRTSLLCHSGRPTLRHGSINASRSSSRRQG